MDTEGVYVCRGAISTLQDDINQWLRGNKDKEIVNMALSMNERYMASCVIHWRIRSDQPISVENNDLNDLFSKRYTWSKKYPACVECGTTNKPHASGGKCRSCTYKAARNGIFAKKFDWSRDHECCVHCGTTTIKHSSYGYCRNCYAKKQYVRRTK